MGSFPENGVWRFSEDFTVGFGNAVNVCKQLLHFFILEDSLATSGKNMLTASNFQAFKCFGDMVRQLNE